MKIRYIELSEALRVGGLEKAAADMATWLGERGHEVVRGEGGLGDTAWDIVHFHGLWSLRHARLQREAERRGIRCIISPHGMLEPWAYRHKRWKKWPYFRMIERGRLRRSGILATAETEAENIRRRVGVGGRVSVLPLGIERPPEGEYGALRAALEWGEAERVLLYLSRIHEKKGLLELLEALRRCVGEGVELGGVRLVIIGDGDAAYVGRCRVAAEAVGGGLRIDWVAPQWGLGKWRYLGGADALCLPTYSENFGLVVLEAGAVGTPVFTTTGTPWKQIADAGHGWVVAPEPSGYAGVLKQLLSEVPVGAKRRAAFVAWTRANYGWEVLVDRYIEYYEKEKAGR